MTSFVAPVCGCILLVTTGVSVFAQAPVVAPVRITADNFDRAETDANLALRVSGAHSAKYYDSPELPLETAGVRTSRDTLYSEAVSTLMRDR